MKTSPNTPENESNEKPANKVGGKPVTTPNYQPLGCLLMFLFIIILAIVLYYFAKT